jgi:hypothetical protein
MSDDVIKEKAKDPGFAFLPWQPILVRYLNMGFSSR